MWRRFATMSSLRYCDSVDILDCVRKCDAACHGCLLTYDTQHDSIRLDRHRARDYLTDEFLAGLDLHERYRILGPDSRVLTRPLPRHLAEVARQPGVEEIRVWDKRPPWLLGRGGLSSLPRHPSVG